MAKTEIRYDTDIPGEHTLPEARITAQQTGAKQGAAKARIVRALRPFFVLVEGMKCPCCKGTIKLEFE